MEVLERILAGVFTIRVSRPQSMNQSSMESTPASLVERLKHREDADAWARFVNLYTPIIFSWARRIGLQEADAGDLVQDVFAVLVQKMASFRYDPGQSFRAWLKTVAINKIRERQRRRGEVQLINGHDIVESADSNTFWEVEFRRELVQRALQIMRTDFQPTSWQACWATVVERRSVEDVAAELGLSAGAVYAARFRILARLRVELAGMRE